jgi:hypothetical protein
MSYSIYLEDRKTGKTVTVPKFCEGGTVQAEVVDGKLVPCGWTEAKMDITYNYWVFYHDTISEGKSIRFIYGKTGAEVIPILDKAISTLGTVRDEDYWKPTPGNAGHALSVLLSWARLHPDAVFEGD